jgi:hypothetical protein
VLEDAIGLGQAALDVAHHDARAVADVALAAKDGNDGVPFPLLVDERRARPQRPRHVEDGRERLVDDLDGRQGRLGRLGSGGRRRRHRLAHVTDLVAGQDRLVLDGAAVADVGHVGRGDDRTHAGKLQRPSHIEADDARVGLRASQNPAPQHAGQAEVRRIHGGAGHLAGGVQARERFADDPGGGAHPTLPAAIAPAAASTASTIFW